MQRGQLAQFPLHLQSERIAAPSVSDATGQNRRLLRLGNASLSLDNDANCVWTIDGTSEKSGYA